MWQQIMWIALAGACGTLARYGISELVKHFSGSEFPWGTLVVNAIGCLAFAFVWSLAEQRQWISPQTRTIMLVGFMGAFTTFSTYMFETDQLYQQGHFWSATGNLLAQNTLGILAILSGVSLAKVV